MRAALANICSRDEIGYLKVPKMSVLSGLDYYVGGLRADLRPEKREII